MADQSSSDEPAEKSTAGPLSLNRLTAAFAQMLGTPAAEPTSTGEPTPAANTPSTTESAIDPCEIGVRSIVEAVLFVGSKEGGSHSAKELAQAMRDVTPEEVETAVAELNAIYQRDSAPYEIAISHAGYRLTLRDEFARMRDKFHGRVKEAKLSPAALEVLSVVAYRQPVSAAKVDELRGVRSGTLLSQLVRRGMIRLDRGAEEGTEEQQTGKPSTKKPTRRNTKTAAKATAHYYTTERFLKLFELQELSQLPQVAELDDA